MRDAELQVVDDALHGVVRLLSGGTEVLLHGPSHGGKDGLGRLSGVHQLTGVFRRGCDCLILLLTLDVSEGFFYCHDQSVRNNEGMKLSLIQQIQSVCLRVSSYLALRLRTLRSTSASS